MAEKTPAELQAELIVKSDLGKFQAKLNSATDEGRFRILETLLSSDPDKYNKYPLR